MTTVVTTATTTPKTPFVRGLRTAAQAIIGTLVGLVFVVWAVPGVPQAVIAYLTTNAPELLVSVGLPSGLISWLWNWYESRSVKTTV